MHKTSLIELLKLFTPKEYRELGDYITSPFFNKNENVINLYSYIRKFLPDLENEGLEKEKVYERITGNLEYNDGFMRTVIFNLNKLAEEYLAHSLRSKIEDEFSLLQAYFDRGSDKLFEKKMKQISDTLSKNESKDQYHYYCLYRLQALKMAYNSKRRAFLNVKDFHEEDEIKTLDSLLTFYLLASLPEYGFFFNQSHVIKIDLEFTFLDEILSYLKRSGFHKKNPELNLYYHQLLLEKDEDEKNFFELKEVVVNNIDEFRYGLKYNSVGLLANKAVNEYYKGKDKFLQEQFDVHNLIIEKGLYKKFENSFFDDMLFKNIVKVALQLNKIEWTEKFIEENIDKLSPDDKPNSYNLNMARLLFYKNKFADALSNLNEIKNVKHIHYKTETKMLSLMINYELENDSEAVSIIDNYKHFLSNDALLTENRKERSYNFLKFTNELIKMRENASKKSVYDLKYELENTPNTFEKEWLISKADLLLNKAK